MLSDCGEANINGIIKNSRSELHLRHKTLQLRYSLTLDMGLLCSAQWRWPGTLTSLEGVLYKNG